MRAATTVIIVATTLGLAACKPGTESPAPTARLQPASVDICDVVLSPDAAGGRADITNLQAVARARSQTVAHLERLGWGFVTAARESADPGFYNLALQTAECIDAAAPDSLEALLLRAHALLQQHRFHDAEGAARTLVARRGWWMDQAVLGDALLEQGQLDAAVVAYQAMADQRPGPEAYARIAQVRWLTGDVDGALDFMTRAARATDGSDAAGTAWYRARLAQLVLQAGDAESALRVARSAANLLPDFPPALAAEGRALLALNRNVEAARVLRRAAERTGLPEHQWLWIEAEQGAGNTAVASLAEALLARTGAATDPRTYSLYLATRGGDPATALRLARDELAVRSDVHTHDALAWALYASGAYAQALEQARLAIALGTPEPRLWLHAALIAARAGDHASARTWLRRAATHTAFLLPSERAQLRAAEASLDDLQPKQNNTATI
jgi:tetratricopeptide (TPR) repeat protein